MKRSKDADADSKQHDTSSVGTAIASASIMTKTTTKTTNTTSNTNPNTNTNTSTINTHTTATATASFVDRLPSRNVSFSHAEIMSLPELSHAIYTNAFPYTPFPTSSSLSDATDGNVNDNADDNDDANANVSNSNSNSIQNHQVRVTGVILHETLGNISVDPECSTRKVGEYLLLGDPLFASSSLSSSSLLSSNKRPISSISSRTVHTRNRAAPAPAPASSSSKSQVKSKFHQVQNFIQQQCQSGRDMVVVNVSNVDLTTNCQKNDNGHGNSNGNGNGNKKNNEPGRTFAVGDLVTVMGTVWLASLHVNEHEMKQLQETQEGGHMGELDTVARLLGEYRWLRDDEINNEGGTKPKDTNTSSDSASDMVNDNHNHVAGDSDGNGNGNGIVGNDHLHTPKPLTKRMKTTTTDSDPNTSLKLSNAQMNNSHSNCHLDGKMDGTSTDQVENHNHNHPNFVERTCGFIEARIVLNVNGTDVKLFLEALNMRRQYLKRWHENEESVYCRDLNFHGE